MEPKISTEAPAELFKELVESALAHQRVDNSEASTAYLVGLLDSFVRHDARYAAAGVRLDQPLSELFLDASRKGPAQASTELRLVGDVALFLTGFFAESLSRQVVGTKAYVLLGGSAYTLLARSRTAPGAAELFEELASRFVRFAEVLSEVSQQCALADPSDLLRLYERWLETGNARSAELLHERGILVTGVSDSVH